MSRPGRARKAQVVESSDSEPASASDVDSDTTAPSPPPPATKPKQAAKKHVSLPQDSPNTSIINNDLQEKAQFRRRQSGGLGDISFASPGGPSAGGQGGSPAGGGGPVRRLAQGEKKRRLSALNGTDGQAVPVPQESVEVMETKFEEWMKLATDNKITVNNTWNFALIDYFADLTLLRNGPDDKSINFQKAARTLDGCVKIWTSRVDSVRAETGKLLSGLSESGAGGDDGDDDDEDGEGEDGEEGGGKKKRKNNSRASTLAPSFASLSTKKLDLEVTVDPLFKKTCADFDEGGATGLLMNHLGIDGTGKLVFDAGDAGVDDGDEDEDEEDEEEDEERKRREAKNKHVDVTGLKAKFLPSLDPILARQISTSLSTFVFSSSNDSALAFDFSMLNNSSADEPSRLDPEDIINPAGDDAGAHDFFDDDDGGGGGGFDVYDGDIDNDGDNGAPGMSMVAGGGGGAYESFDPSRGNERDMFMAMVGGGGEDGADEAGEMFGYFDKDLLGKNWVGRPEHWKMRRQVVKKDDAATTTKSARSAKAAFSIDFASPEPPTPRTKVFETGTKTATMLPNARAAADTPGSKSKKKKTSTAKDKKAETEKWLLPDDLHFSSTQLLRLFMKKTFTLRMRKADTERLNNARGDGEVDEEFWAQAAADQAQQAYPDDDNDNFGDGENPMPFNTQFFHDNGDGDVGLDPDSGSERGADDDGPTIDSIGVDDEDNLWAGTQGLKRTRPDYVKYTKRAKRVDVKRLKDSIWKGLEIFAPPIEGEAEDDEPMEAPPPDAPDEPPRVFSSVVSSLQKAYPADKMSDISTSYCFICLLHLCNERGLQIETARAPGQIEEVDKDMEDAEMEKRGTGGKNGKMVGELGWLKISKDKNAKGHA